MPELLLLACLLAAKIATLRWLAANRGLNPLLARGFGIFSSVLMLGAILTHPNIWPAASEKEAQYWRAGLMIWSLLVPLTVMAYAAGQLPQVKQKPGRRSALQVIAAAPWAATTYGIVSGRRDFRLTEVRIPIRNLPKALDGYRIVQLSDIHYGQFLSAGELRHVVGMANETKANLAVVTGDLITREASLLAECLGHMKELRCDGGIYACHGNHEVYADCEAEASRLGAAMGWQFLRGETRRISSNGGSFFLSGVDYAWGRKHYLAELTHFPAPGETHLLLSHNPDTFVKAARLGYDLTISGHTHGGQINIEVMDRNLNAVSAFTPYTYGSYEKDDRHCFVSSGIGTIGVPIRIGAPPEVALIQLCAS